MKILKPSLTERMSQPLAPSGAAAPNTQDLAHAVRNYVHYDNLATGLYRQTVNARKVRDEFEVKILETLRVCNMENAMIQIANGRLCVQEERHNQPLTLRRLEEILHSYHVSNNKPDDTTNIMRFFKNQRGFEVVKKLKKQAGPVLPPLPGPPKS